MQTGCVMANTRTDLTTKEFIGFSFSYNKRNSSDNSPRTIQAQINFDPDALNLLESDKEKETENKANLYRQLAYSIAFHCIPDNDTTLNIDVIKIIPSANRDNAFAAILVFHPTEVGEKTETKENIALQDNSKKSIKRILFKKDHGEEISRIVNSSSYDAAYKEAKALEKESFEKPQVESGHHYYNIEKAKEVLPELEKMQKTLVGYQPSLEEGIKKITKWIAVRNALIESDKDNEALTTELKDLFENIDLDKGHEAYKKLQLKIEHFICSPAFTHQLSLYLNQRNKLEYIKKLCARALNRIDPKLENTLASAPLTEIHKHIKRLEPHQKTAIVTPKFVEFFKNDNFTEHTYSLENTLSLALERARLAAQTEFNQLENNLIESDIDNKTDEIESDFCAKLKTALEIIKSDLNKKYTGLKFDLLILEQEIEEAKESIQNKKAIRSSGSKDEINKLGDELKKLFSSKLPDELKARQDQVNDIKIKFNQLKEFYQDRIKRKEELKQILKDEQERLTNYLENKEPYKNIIQELRDRANRLYGVYLDYEKESRVFKDNLQNVLAIKEALELEEHRIENSEDHPKYLNETESLKISLDNLSATLEALKKANEIAKDIANLDAIIAENEKIFDGQKINEYANKDTIATLRGDYANFQNCLAAIKEKREALISELKQDTSIEIENNENDPDKNKDPQALIDSLKQARKKIEDYSPPKQSFWKGKVLGTLGGIFSGAIIGGAIGTVTGFFLAPLTLGTSIPIFATIGAIGGGIVGGSVVGGGFGFGLGHWFDKWREKHAQPTHPFKKPKNEKREPSVSPQVGSSKDNDRPSPPPTSSIDHRLLTESNDDTKNIAADSVMHPSPVSSIALPEEKGKEKVDKYSSDTESKNDKPSSPSTRAFITRELTKENEKISENGNDYAKPPYQTSSPRPIPVREIGSVRGEENEKHDSSSSDIDPEAKDLLDEISSSAKEIARSIDPLIHKRKKRTILDLEQPTVETDKQKKQREAWEKKQEQMNKDLKNREIEHSNKAADAKPSSSLPSKTKNGGI